MPTAASRPSDEVVSSGQFDARNSVAALELCGRACECCDQRQENKRTLIERGAVQLRALLFSAGRSLARSLESSMNLFSRIVHCECEARIDGAWPARAWRLSDIGPSLKSSATAARDQDKSSRESEPIHVVVVVVVAVLVLFCHSRPQPLFDRLLCRAELINSIRDSRAMKRRRAAVAFKANRTASRTNEPQSP